MKKLALLALLVLPGCLGTCEGIGATTQHLHHDYYVHDALGDLVLDCKLAYPSDPRIGPRVNAVEWNNHAIVATVQTETRTAYYIVEAAGAELECGNHDVVYGPLTETELIQKRDSLGLARKLDKQAQF